MTKIQQRRACENIFRRVLERNKQKYKKTPPLRQLQLLGMYIEDYKDIFGRNAPKTKLIAHKKKEDGSRDNKKE
jgi:hypothetical protein